MNLHKGKFMRLVSSPRYDNDDASRLKRNAAKADEEIKTVPCREKYTAPHRTVEFQECRAFGAAESCKN